MVNAAPAGRQRDGAVRARWRTTKRRRAQVAPGEELDSEDSLHQLLENALVLKPAPHTFDMDNFGDRVQLAMVVWSSEPLLGPLSVASATLIVLMTRSCIRNELISDWKGCCPTSHVLSLRSR